MEHKKQVPLPAILKKQEEIRKWIIENHPEVAERYMDPSDTQRRIVLDYHLTERFPVSLDTALNGVHQALFGTDDEPGLIPAEQVKEVRTAHNRHKGLQTRSQHIGIYGLTPEQRAENAKRAGRFGGQEFARRRGHHLWYNDDPLEPGSALQYLFELKYKHGRLPATEAAAHLTQTTGEEYTAREVTAIVNKHKGDYARFVQQKTGALERQAKYHSWRSQRAQDVHRKRESHFLDANGNPTKELECILASQDQTIDKILKHIENEYHHHHKPVHIQYALKRLGRRLA